MFFPKASLTALSVATLVAVAGCGGSSSSGNQQPGPVDPGPLEPTGVQVTGEAIKGVLKNAPVTAYELNDQGERLEGIIAEPTTTNDQGEYTLELNDTYAGGLLEVVVSADDNTTMVCDASQCGDIRRGENVPVSGDFSLTSIVEKDSDSDTVSASVTAWSTMAANRAKTLLQNGEKSDLREARRQANSEVRQVVGFNFDEVKARGVSQLEGSSSDESQYALVNAAVAEIVFRDNGDSFAAQLQQFTEALNDGRLGDSEDNFSAAEFGQALSKAIRENSDRVNSDASDALANQVARLESAGSDGFTPDYDEDLDLGEDADDAEKIAAYKAFMEQARTWLSSAGELSTEQLLSAVTIDEDTLRATIDSDTQTRFQFLGEVVGQVAGYSVENTSKLLDLLASGGGETIDIKDNAGTVVGQAELAFADSNGLTISVSGAATGADGGAFVPFELTLGTTIPVDSFKIEHANNSIQSARLARLLSNTALTINANIGDVNSSHYLQLNDVTLSVAMSADIESDASGDFDSDKIESELQGANFAGQVAINSGGYRFNGDASFELVRLNNDARLFGGTEFEGDVLAPKVARLRGEFISADDATRFSAVVSANLHNAAAFDTFNWLSTKEERVYFSGWLDQEIAESVVAQSYPEQAVRPEHAWFEISRDFAYVNSSFFTENPNEFYQVWLSSDNFDDEFDPHAVILAGLSDDFQVKLEEHDGYDTITGAEILASAQVDSAWFFSGREDWESQDKVMLTYQVPADLEVVWADFSSDHYNEGSAHYSNGELEISLILPGAPGERLAEVVSNLQNDLVAISHARDFFFQNSSSDGGLTLDVPNTEAAYNYCVSNSDVFSPYVVDNPESFCAGRLLTNDYEERSLTEAEQDLLISVVEAQLEKEGSAVAGIDYIVNTANVSVGSGLDGLEGYWYATVELDDAETSDYYLQGSLTASLGLILPELPAAQLTTTLNRTSFNGGSLRANVDWNGGNYTLDLSGNNLDKPSELALRFFNAQGYELLLDVTLEAGSVATVTGEASINGEALGEVQWRDGQPALVFQDGDEADIQSLY